MTLNSGFSASPCDYNYLFSRTQAPSSLIIALINNFKISKTLVSLVELTPDQCVKFLAL